MTAFAHDSDAGPAVSATGPAFRAGPRLCSLDDILVAAGLSGGLAAFRAAWARRRAAAAAAAGLAPDPAAIEAATAAFRYARDLVSAEECERWLNQRGLSFAELTASVTRRLQAGLATAEESAAPDERAGEDGEQEARFRTDALLADEFTGWARGLAWRLALAQEQDALPADETAGKPGQNGKVQGGSRGRESVAVGDRNSHRLTSAATGSLADAWPELEARFTAVCAALATPERHRRELAGQRLQLLRLELAAAEFESEAAAREASLCAREDGVALAVVAEANGFPVFNHVAFLGDLTPDWQQALISARPGDVTPPLTGGDVAVVLQLLGKREPSLDDAAVCARLDADLRRQHFGELEAKHVRWLINVEVER